MFKYNVAKIEKCGYKEMDIFILLIISLSEIPKTMIYVDSINKKIVLIEYLCIKFLNNLKNKAKQII